MTDNNKRQPNKLPFFIHANSNIVTRIRNPKIKSTIHTKYVLSSVMFLQQSLGSFCNLYQSSKMGQSWQVTMRINLSFSFLCSLILSNNSIACFTVSLGISNSFIFFSMIYYFAQLRPDWLSSSFRFLLFFIWFKLIDVNIVIKTLLTPSCINT